MFFFFFLMGAGLKGEFCDALSLLVSMTVLKRNMQDVHLAFEICIPDEHDNEYMSRLMTKPTKWYVRPAKTQISLGIRPV